MSIYPAEVVQEVLNQLEIIPTLKFINYRTDTIQDSDNAVRCFCPVHKESVFRTLKISKPNQKYVCSYNMCGASKPGDLVRLVALAKEIDYDEALRLIVAHFELPVNLPPPTEFIQQSLEVGENYLELGVLDEAEEEFKKILQLEPENIPALCGMVELLRQRNNPTERIVRQRGLFQAYLKQQLRAEALAVSEELLLNAPNDLELREKRAECFLETNRIEEAVNEWMSLADCHENSGDYEAALEVYDLVQQHDPGLVDVNPHRALALVSMGRNAEAAEQTLKSAKGLAGNKKWNEAFSCYRFALEINSAEEQVCRDMVETAVAAGLNDTLLGDCLRVVDHYLHQNSPTVAEEMIGIVKRKRSAHPRVLRKEIEVLMSQGRAEQAVQLQLDYLKKLLEKKRPREAWRLLRELLRQEPLEMPVLMELAAAAEQLGDTRAAIQILMREVEAGRKNGDYRDALLAYGRMYELAPEQPEFLLGAVQLLLEHNETGQVIGYIEKLVEYYAARHDWVPLSDALQQGASIDPFRIDWRERLAETLNFLDQPERAAQHALEAARLCSDQEDWGRALKALDHILRHNPHHLKALELSAQIYKALNQVDKLLEQLRALAMVCIEKQENSQAEKVLQQMLELKPDSIEALELLGELCLSTGDLERFIATQRKLTEELIRRESFARAIESATAVLDHRPDDVEMVRRLIEIFEATEKKTSALEMKIRLAELHHQRAEHDQEIELLVAIIESDPNNLAPRLKLVQALVQTHRFEDAVSEALETLERFGHGKQVAEAVEAANRVLDYDADHIDLQRRLTEVYKRNGMKAQWAGQATQLINCYARRNMQSDIAALYQELVREEPNNINFRMNLIAAWRELQQDKKVRAELLELAQYYRLQGNFEDAAASLKQLLEDSPDDEEAHECLAEIFRDGDQQEELAATLNQLGEVYLKHGDSQKALDCFYRLLELEPENTAVREKVLAISSKEQAHESQVRERRALAEVLLKKGNYDEALHNLREAAAIKPDDPETRRMMVRVFSEMGQRKEAVDELWAIVEIYQQSGDHAEVLRTLNEILRLDPRNGRARKLRAETYVKTGQEKQALEEFMRLSGEIQNLDAPALTPPPGAETDGEHVTVISHVLESMPIVKEYTFETFIVGDRNNFAFATAQAVAKAPARHYNPVFIWSDVGLGKTHLVNAIANHIEKRDPTLRIHYTNAEEFTQQLIDFIGANQQSALRNYYKKIDVLLVDDVHFLEGKEKAQEEFFHVFNMLFQAKKQIVVTCDRPPKELKHLEKRLRSRFGSGVIIDIQPPDLETRIAILKQEAAAFPDIKLDPAILELLADQLTTNVRALKGALNQLIVNQQISKEPLGEKLARKILQQYQEAV